MKIITPRLILRDMKMSDAKDIKKNINDLNVSKWLAVVKYPYKLKDATDWIKRLQKGSKEKKPKKEVVFGIELKETKSIIGGMGIHKIDKETGIAEVGYWLGRKYHGVGYGTEALKAVINHAFEKLKLRRLEATVKVGNPSSGKLLELYGFKKEGLKKEGGYSRATKTVCDLWIYGLLKKNYKK